jgi:hypothetical protein
MSPHGPSHGLEKAGIPAKPPRLIGPADNHVGQVVALKAPHVQEADLKFCVLLPYLHRHIKVLEYAPRCKGLNYSVQHCAAGLCSVLKARFCCGHVSAIPTRLGPTLQRFCTTSRARNEPA